MYIIIPNNILHVTCIKRTMTLRMAQRVLLSIVIADFDHYNISRMVTKSATRVKLFEIQATISSLVHGVKQFAHLQKAKDFIRHETSGEESYIDRRCPDLKKRSKKGKAG